MRFVVALAILTVWSAPSLANGAMRQSPLLMHKAGPACDGKYRGPQRGAGYRYQLGGCAPVGR